MAAPPQPEYMNMLLNAVANSVFPVASANWIWVTNPAQ
jgi:hypothetical protein